MDESSLKTNFTPLRGWSEKGKRCKGVRPGKWKTYTMVNYLKYTGETYGMVYSGGTTKDIFKEFMEEILLPVVSKGDIIILDNLNVHKNSFDESKFTDKGVQIKPIPRYSPEFNPIEMMWSKHKNFIRKQEPRDELDIWREASEANFKVTAEDAHGWYNHCGYCH